MTDQSNLLNTKYQAIDKAKHAYLAFSVLFLGGSFLATTCIPDPLGVEIARSSLGMIWALLWMAAARTTRHFGKSFVVAYLLPGLASTILAFGYSRALIMSGFDPVGEPAPDLLLGLVGIGIIAAIGAISSALVRALVWAKFEMTPAFSK